VSDSRHCYAWTESDTKAYWSEVEREKEFDRRGGRASIYEPHWDKIPDSSDQLLRGSSSRHLPELVYFRSVVIRRALGCLPLRDKETLGVAMSKRGGRNGDGKDCARLVGVGQTTWVERMNVAERRLKIVIGMMNELGVRSRKSVVNSSKWPQSVSAYLDCWSTAGAANILGMRQSTVYYHLKKTPAILYILNRWR
jgi:hypothetical protein